MQPLCTTTIFQPLRKNIVQQCNSKRLKPSYCSFRRFPCTPWCKTAWARSGHSLVAHHTSWQLKFLLIADLFVGWSLGCSLLSDLKKRLMIPSGKKTPTSQDVWLRFDCMIVVLNFWKRKLLSCPWPYTLAFIALVALFWLFDSLKVFARDVILSVLMALVCTWMIMCKHMRGRWPELLAITQAFFHNLSEFTKKSELLGCCQDDSEELIWTSW